MAVKIDSKIVDYRVHKNSQSSPTDAAAESSTAGPTGPTGPTQSAESAGTPVDKPSLSVNESLQRPYELHGTTYKVKTPVSDHAMYITINDVILNEGTEHEVRRPFEIFINSKNLDHFQWIVALTRIISAVFRKGGDVTFLVEELKAVFDPRGGYWKTGGKYMPSLIAEIGEVIERHLTRIGLIETKELSPAQKQLLAEKRAEYEARQAIDSAPPAAAGVSPDVASAPGEPAVAADAAAEEAPGFPAGATLCPQCNTKAVILMDGCRTCLNCGDSKCG